MKELEDLRIRAKGYHTHVTQSFAKSILADLDYAIAIAESVGPLSAEVSSLRAVTDRALDECDKALGAARVLRETAKACISELGVPGDGYPAPVANTHAWLVQVLQDTAWVEEA